MRRVGILLAAGASVMAAAAWKVRPRTKTVVSPKLDALVTGWVARSYLKSDGWWADLVIEQFGFLEAYGIEVTEVFFHHTDHTITFLGPRHVLMVGYGDWKLCWGSISWLDSHEAWPLDDLIQEHDPDTPLPSLEPFGKETVSRRIRYWAAGLEKIAPTVLSE